MATAQAQPGVLGARMTGAGFGGCAIALVLYTTADMGQLRQQCEICIREEVIGYETDIYRAAIDDNCPETKINT